MKLLVVVAIAVALLAPALLVAQGGKPTAEECKRNPKLPGCEQQRK